MSHMVRALRQWPSMVQKHCCGCAVHHFLFSSPPWVAKRIYSRRLSLATVHSARREVQYESKGLRLSKAPALAKSQEHESINDDDLDVRKSRNQLKREARRAVQWGMDLATFSTSQIKRILSVTSLEKDVFDAIMLVKRLGNDVREGKRRQFNYIGKLLRDAQPDTELMDVLIQSTKAGDHKILQRLCASVDDEVSKYVYEEEEEEEEGPHVDIATRWLDGLISKNNIITKEIYSLQTVEFDRQELRRLVRKVHMVEERKAAIEENGDEVNTAVTNARKPLARFLCRMAKQLPSDEL
ncbi:uncharacterized protein LOC101214378 [Cucumis sativus]|uniref:Uncharacterized protein n=1 Tax=Cucumis sativus TaxID=3659 RepID=A0A0A0LH61_CUCSA|nr:uncharacterized protein LOC101214378 [Cucumis sativus]KGN60042.1 hypothetical protein Csa_001476 [Cucumis sativus]